MNLLLVLLLECLAIAIVFHRLRKLRIRIEQLGESPPKSHDAVVALGKALLGRYLTEVARDALLVTAGTIGVLLLVVLVAMLVGSAGSDVWAGKHLLASVRSRLLILKPMVSGVSLVFGIVAMWVLICRTAGRQGARLSEELKEHYKRARSEDDPMVIATLEQLAGDPYDVLRGGAWDEAWKKEEVIDARMQLDAAWDHYVRSRAASGPEAPAVSSVSRPWSTEKIAEQRAYLAQLKAQGRGVPEAWDGDVRFGQYVRALEAFRSAVARSYTSVVNDANRTPESETKAASLVEAGRRLTVGRTLHRSLSVFNRGLYYACLALLVVAWVGIAGDPGLRGESIRLTDLAITRLEGTSQTDQPPAAGAITDDDRRMVRRAARVWEERTFRPSTPPPAPKGQPPSSEHPTWLTAEYEVRSGATRETILFDGAEGPQGPKGPEGPEGRGGPRSSRRRYETATVNNRPPDPGHWFGPDRGTRGPDSPGPGPSSPGPRPAPNPSGPSSPDLLGGSEKGGPFAVDSQGPKPGGPQPSWKPSASGAAVLQDAAAAQPQAREARVVLTAFEQSLATDGPVSEAGRAMEARLLGECQRSQPFLSNLRRTGGALVGHFRPSSPIAELRGLIFARTVDVMFQVATGGHGGDEFAEVIWALTSPTPGAAVDLHDALRVKAKRSQVTFVEQIRKGGDLEASLAAAEQEVRRADDVVVPAAREVRAAITQLLPQDSPYAQAVDNAADVFRQRSPAAVEVPEKGVNLAKARTLIEAHLVERSKKLQPRERGLLASLAEEGSQALVTFDDYFPAQPGADDATERGRLRKTYFPDAPDDGVQMPGPNRHPGEGEAPGSTGPRPEDPPPAWGAGGSGPALPPPPPPGRPASEGSPGRGGRGSGWRSWFQGGRPRGGINLSSGVSGSGFARAFRARSFVGLRGFTRIGGVLIGQAPNPQNAVPFTDLRWRWTADGRVILTLVDPAGKTFDSAPYRPDIVAHALRYAADGRATTVTMVRAEPMPSLRILLHPTLVDSSLGDELQQLDRLVDTYAGPSSGSEVGAHRTRVEGVAGYQAEIYDALWLAGYSLNRKLAGEDPDFAGIASQTVANAQRFSLRAAKLGRSFVEKPLPREYVEALELLGDPGRSPYAARSSKYDSALLAALKEVGQRNEPTYRDLLNILQDVEFDTHRPPLEWIPWSGVREKPFQINSRDLLMRKQDDLSDLPLSFMWQVAFDTRDNQPSVEPWEDAELKPLIEKEVPALAGRSLDDLRVMRDAREFTYLQRLFRTALSGWMGPRFPVERLVELHRAVQEFVPDYRRTLRWNSAPSRDSITTALAGLDNSPLPAEYLEPERRRLQLMLDLYEPLGLGADAAQSSLEGHDEVSAFLRALDRANRRGRRRGRGT